MEQDTYVVVRSEEGVAELLEGLGELYGALPTLRDRFAMAALASLVTPERLYGGGLQPVAERAYQYADAMMAARVQR